MQNSHTTHWATSLAFLQAILLISQELASAPVPKGPQKGQNNPDNHAQLPRRTAQWLPRSDSQAAQPSLQWAGKERCRWSKWSLQTARWTGSVTCRRYNKEQQRVTQGLGASREDTERKACFSLLSDPHSHGRTRHPGQHFYCHCMALTISPF